MPQSPDIGKNSDGGAFGFWISVQTLTKVNFHNSTTSDNEIKLGPVTKFDTKNKAASKKIDDDVMTETCDVIIMFPIYGQFGAIRKPDSRCIVCKT